MDLLKFPSNYKNSSSLGGSLFDKIISRTGAIGMKLRGFSQKALARSVLEDAKHPYKNPDKQQPNLAINPSEVFQNASSPFDDSNKFRTHIITDSGLLFVFDAVTEIGIEFPSKVTQYPVEDGSTISDHIINENAKFSVRGIFSDGSANLNPFKGNPQQGGDKVADIVERLFVMRNERETVNLVTSINAFADLVITNISLPRNGSIGNTTLLVDLQLERIRKVSTKRTIVKIDAKGKNGDTANKTAKEQDGGAKKAPAYLTPLDANLDENKLSDAIQADPSLSNKYLHQLSGQGRTASDNSHMGTASQMNDFLKKNKKGYNASDYQKSGGS